MNSTSHHENTVAASHSSDGTLGLVAGAGNGAIAGGLIGAAVAGPVGALLGLAAGTALGAAGGEAAAHIGHELDEEIYGDGLILSDLNQHADDEAFASLTPSQSTFNPADSASLTGLPMSADIYGMNSGWLTDIPDPTSDAEIARQAREDVETLSNVTPNVGEDRQQEDL